MQVWVGTFRSFLSEKIFMALSAIEQGKVEHKLFVIAQMLLTISPLDYYNPGSLPSDSFFFPRMVKGQTTLHSNTAGLNLLSPESHNY